MRVLLTILGAVVLSQAACKGGAWGIGFSGTAMPTAAPGSTATVTGELDTHGVDNGLYTVTATPSSGADSCMVSANGGPAAASIQVDTSSGDQTVKLVVTIQVSKTATLNADCKVVATSNADPSQHQGADASVILGP